MARTVKEWIGKNDDAAIPVAVKRRILERQDGCCALTKMPFGPKNKPEYDHKVPLWLGGQHRESNLQAICREPHLAKTKAEATVRAKTNRQLDKHLGLKEKAKAKIASRPKEPKPEPKLDYTTRRSLFAPAQAQEQS